MIENNYRNARRYNCLSGSLKEAAYDIHSLFGRYRSNSRLRASEFNWSKFILSFTETLCVSMFRLNILQVWTSYQKHPQLLKQVQLKRNFTQDPTSYWIYLILYRFLFLLLFQYAARTCLLPLPLIVVHAVHLSPLKTAIFIWSSRPNTSLSRFGYRNLSFLITQ